MVSRNRDGRRETLAIFRSRDFRNEPLTTSEVADQLDCSRRVAADRLYGLVDDGVLETKRVGECDRVWWSPTDGEISLDAGDDGEHTTDEREPDGERDAGRGGVVIVDAEGDVAWIDQTASALFDVAQKDVVGRDRNEFLRTVLADRVDDADVEALVSVTDRETAVTEPRAFDVRGGGKGRIGRLEFTSKPIDSGRYAGGRVECFTEVAEQSAAVTTDDDQEPLFRSLVEATTEYAIFMLDPDGHVVSWNPGAERIKGYAESEIVGEHFSTFYTEADVEADVPQENLSRALEEGAVEDEGWRVRADGERFWANVTISPVRDADGTLRGFTKVTRDMTERRQWEERLQDERDLLAGVFDSVPVSIGVLSPDGEFVRANQRATERLGAVASEEDRYRLGTHNVYDEDGEFVPHERRPYRQVFETGEAVTDWRCQIELPEHGRRWLSITATPMRTDGGEVERVIVCSEDVTQVKEQAAHLERQRDELQSELDDVFDRVSNAFLGLDDEWRFTYVNEHAEEVLGRDEAELLGAPIWDEFEPAVGTAFETNYREAMETQETVHFEAYYEPLEAWFEIDAYPSESGLSVYFRDVTDRKTRERELERYETLFEGSEDVNAVVDPDGTFTYVTPSATHVLGYDPDELAGENAFEYIHPDDRERMWKEYTGVIEDPDSLPTVEFRFEHADGSWVVLEAQAQNFLDDPNIDGVVAYTRDATERKLFEDALQALHESSRELIRSEEKSDVSRTVIEAATTVLDLPDVVTYRYDADDDALALDETSAGASFTDDVTSEFPVDHSNIVGHTYCDGEANYYDDVRESDHLLADAEEVDVHAGFFVPMGDHGVLTVGWPDGGDCDERTRRLIEVLAANAEAAYDRVERKRELERAERRYRTLAENFPDGAVGVFDEDLRYTLVEGAIWDELDIDSRELEDEHVSDVFSEDAVATIESLYRDAMGGTAGSDQVSFGERVFRVWALPMCDDRGTTFAGLSFGIDITDQVERERELERYETIVETVDDGVYVLDEEFHFTDVNEAYAEMTGYDREELVGTHCSLVVDEEVTAESARRVEEMLAEDGNGETIEAEIHRADGTRLPAESNFSPLPGDDGEDPGKVGVVRDVSERIERERELEESRRRYSTLVENFPNGAVAMVDEEMRYVTVGGDSIAEPDASATTLEGSHVEEHLSPELAEVFVPNYEIALDGETTSIEQRVADTVYRIRFVPVRDDDGEVFAAIGVSQDVTAQVEYERELETRVHQQEAIAELGRRALENPDLDDLFDDAVERVADTLDNEYCKVLDLDQDAEELLLRSGVGWNEGYVGTATVGTDRESQAGYTLLAEEPIVVEEMAAESRFTGPDLLADHGVASGISAVIGSPTDPWGILGTHDTERREFSENDALFVQSVANILATAIARRNNEVKLERQREHLAAVNSLNGVVREINEAVVEQSTRERIERTVCERLADSYEFAWIGEIDSRSGSIEPHVEAGVDGYVESTEMSVDEGVPEGQGPTGRAARSRETQATHDALADEAYEPWRDTAEEYGFRSTAAIPIVHQDTLYGILGVYTDRVGAFADEEREVVSQLGEIIGHAIAAAERKQALMSDDVVEIEMRMENVLDEVGLSEPMSGRIAFDDAVSVGDGTFLQYGTATDGALETVESLVELLPHWEAVNVLDDEFGGTHFELRLSEPPVVSAVADRGGYIDEAIIEDGTMYMAIHLPSTVDVRRMVDTIQDVYPVAEMMTRQQVSRSDSREQIERTLTEELTDRQRAALEASFHAGFFDWPRESSGEEVAESLDVSAPTFHQHLRKAEQKLLEVVLSR